MENAEKAKFGALEDLIVLLAHHANKIKWSWGVVPEYDGLGALFHSAVRGSNTGSLKNYAASVVNEFDNAFFAACEDELGKGRKSKEKTIVDKEASDPVVLTIHWAAIEIVSSEIMNRLKNTDQAAYDNMKGYYDRACEAFGDDVAPSVQKNPDSPAP